MKKKIILANSIGIDKNGYYIVHSPSRWSLGVKGYTDCIYYPFELAYTSSLLKQKTEHKIKLIDGVYERLNSKKLSERIIKAGPDFLIMEPGTRTIIDDEKVINTVKRNTDANIILTGAHTAYFYKRYIDNRTAVVKGEYENVVQHLVKNFKPGFYNSLDFRKTDFDKLPMPEDEDISRINYFEPNCEYREIQMYASRGCAMKCNFCIAQSSYYQKPVWQKRTVKKIIKEIKYLKKKYPQMEGIFFDEEVHNMNKKFIMELTDAIIANKLNNLKYNAMCEYFNLDEKVMMNMKKAGYYKLRIGIETASEKTAKNIGLGKKFNIQRLINVLEQGKKIGLKFYGTFTIGNLYSNEKEDLKTVKLIYKLVSRGLLTDLQISIATPLPSTLFYEECRKNNYLITDNFYDYDGGKGSIVSYPDYTKKQIDNMYSLAHREYDRALEKRLKKKLQKDFNIILNDYLKEDNILIVRSFRHWFIKILLDYFEKNKFNNINLAVQEGEQKYYDPDKLKSYLLLEKGFLNIKNHYNQLINFINKEKIQKIIFPVRNIRTKNFTNILEIINKLKHKNIQISIIDIYAERETIK